ncbi:trafficking protein Mon1-domain-containing protein [Podospora fimiseda]|uniref:Vacuolar fusion protein MON1 n=1 Tax=Podospora fimiseda TaxID=252190 RepID=A0AAN7BW11_9PEZI|nr:trafficking protein Mon1-domain-containing protein [Podospora fimiseda]
MAPNKAEADTISTNNDTLIVAKTRATPSPSPPPPPLPPRRNISGDWSPKISAGFQSKPTTALSSIDISTLSFPDGTRGTFTTDSAKRIGSPLASGYATPRRASVAGDHTDSMSIMSFTPTLRPHGDLASLVAGSLNKKSRAWKLLRSQSETVIQPFENIGLGISGELEGFEREFVEIPDDLTDDIRLALWHSKMKHFMILSSAGKPIYSRHGDLSLINSSMGVVQTIISFYEGQKDPLLGFTAGDARFVVLTEGPLYFVAISRLGESDSQLRSQLEALYMQILSTLTLPTLKNIFVHRPSTDLRKPLEGTESLLSSLADSFTKGSPSALLGALECLKLRKSQRHSINNVFLKNRADKLLYGLIVAGGKLVSVIRPRKHSLHPSDLQLIFNMLFESGGIKAGGGESWIPLCLPAFNNRGYLYMYVSFFDNKSDGDDNPPSTTHSRSKSQSYSTPPIPEEPLEGEEVSSEASHPPQPQPSPPPSPPSEEEEIAIILISADKESFFALKEMRDKLASSLQKQGYLSLIRSACQQGRPKISTIFTSPQQETQLTHFLYKSRANVQFVMSSLEPFFSGPEPEKQIAKRKLMSVYHQLHASIHAKHSHLKVLHSVGEDSASLAWITPVFELYCVAGPNVSRAAMTMGANRVVQWAKKEEERLFIIGGGVF